STLSIQGIIPLNHSAGSWVDDFPIQRMSVLVSLRSRGDRVVARSVRKDLSFH
ncbi:hypothetical protein BE221DRAFT_65078, partial [Ostreococcus tauri]